MDNIFIVLGIVFFFVCLFIALFWYIFINKKNSIKDSYSSKPKKRFRYLDTFYSILGIQYRYQSLAGSHELYCMGHFIEAAVAYYVATGNEKVLSVAKKAADNIDDNFGPEDGKIHGYDGHEEIEIGLLRLFHVTGENRYLNLAKYFLMERGKHPDFFR